MSKEEATLDATTSTDAWIAEVHGTLAAIRQKGGASLPAGTELQAINDWFNDATKELQERNPGGFNPYFLRTVLSWCRFAGRLHLFDQVVDSADIVLQLGHLHQASPLQYALANAYKGFALMKMKKQLQRCEKALPCLEQAYTLFQQHPPPKQQQHASLVLSKVEETILTCCRILQREPPLPSLIKFPRTAHLFRPTNSKAVTEDDQVLAQDHAMLKSMCDGETIITMEEKVDGANLGISLSLDGQRFLVQNRSHYISTVEHAQFGQLTAFLEEHREGLMQILTHDDDDADNEDNIEADFCDIPGENTTKQSHRPHRPVRRRILFGEWLVARHSIPYGQLPKYFVAFDLYDIPSERFVSCRRLHTILQGTGIPVAPLLGRRTFGPYKNTKAMEKELMQILTTTKSNFRTDGGLIEGIIFRFDDKDWLLERSKLVRPDFVAGCQDGHWSKRAIDKQTIDFEFAEEYLQNCYSQAASSSLDGLPTSVENPRQRVLITYQHRLENTEVESATLTIVNGNPKTSTTGEQRQVLLPRNLCWLWDDEVAVSSTPTSAEQITAFRDTMNIGLVITLTQEEPLPNEWFSSPVSANADNKDESVSTKQCQNIFHGIRNGSPPTLQQMDHIGDDIVRAVVDGNAVLEHCGGGKGRAGSIAAALLLRFGCDGIRDRLQSENSESSWGCLSLRSKPPFMTSEEAIQVIRQRRPGSLETIQQEEFVRQYAQHLWRLAAAEEVILDAPQSVGNSAGETAPILTTRSPKPMTKTQQSLPNYIVLTGIPGSGKSTIGTLLAKHHSSSRRSTFIHANQDELGSRMCQDFVGRECARVEKGQVAGIVVDCCSVREADRLNWLKIMHQPPAHKNALVFVDTPVDVCVARVQSRVDHPTIPFGRGERIVRGFAKKLEPPTEKERKLFGQIEVLRSTQDMLDLLQQWGIPSTAE